MRGATHIKRETLQHVFPFFGEVAVILGSSGGEFDDMIIFVEFVDHVSKKISKWNVGLSRQCRVHDRICVKIQDSFLESFKGLVKLESCVTGGESGNEDIDSAIIGLIFFDVLGYDFKDVFIDDFLV